jgi:hypothetical protein
MNREEALSFIVNAKESYRSEARALTWEQKVASIELMRDAGEKAREGMRATLAARAQKPRGPSDAGG